MSSTTLAVFLRMAAAPTFVSEAGRSLRQPSMPPSPLMSPPHTIDYDSLVPHSFSPQARAERYEASELFFSAKMEEHSSVSEHVAKMSGYVQRLNALECKIPDRKSVV